MNHAEKLALYHKVMESPEFNDHFDAFLVLSLSKLTQNSHLDFKTACARFYMKGWMDAKGGVDFVVATN